MTDDTMTFRLETLAGAAERAQSLSVCADGHLVVVGRTHYRPKAFTEDLRGIICDWVEHEADDA